MINAIRPICALLVLGLIVAPAPAHFNMLLPESATVKRGEPVSVVYQWGHPFEHQLFDAPLPQSIAALAPDGSKTALDKALEKASEPMADGTKATIYRFPFTPPQRGDFILSLTTPPIWMEEDHEYLQDFVKVVVHVQAQKGWEAAAGLPFEMMPLTRPYGLQPGMAFQTQARVEGGVAAGALVEIERYHSVAPRHLPADEFITRTARTDPNGVVTCTLTDPGWWCIAAERQGGKKDREGVAVPVRYRAILWVYVDEKAAVP